MTTSAALSNNPAAGGKGGAKTLDDDDGPDASLRHLLMTPGVTSYLILNRTGIPVKYSGMEHNTALHYAAALSELTLAASTFITDTAAIISANAHNVHGAASNTNALFGGTSALKSDHSQIGGASGGNGSLTTFRLKTKRNEIVIAPDEHFTLIVVHSNQSNAAADAAAAAAITATTTDKAEGKKPAAINTDNDAAAE